MEPDPRSQEKGEMPSSPPADIKSPVEKEHPAMAGHDSMVTVRLSEPPSLSVRTDLPVWPSRRSLFGPEYMPTPTSAASPKKFDLGEKTMDKTEQVGDKGEEKGETAASHRHSDGDASKSLSEELEEATGNDTPQRETSSPRESEEDSEDDDEEVDWEKLQKSEDEQAQKDDNVSFTDQAESASDPPAVTHITNLRLASHTVYSDASGSPGGGEQQTGLEPKGCQGQGG